MRAWLEFEIAFLPAGANKKTETLRFVFRAHWIQKSKNGKVPATFYNLGHIYAPLFTPSPLTRTNLYSELVGNNYFRGHFLFFGTPPVSRSIPLLFYDEVEPISLNQNCPRLRGKKAPFFVCREAALTFDLDKGTQSRPGPARPPAAYTSNCRFKVVCLRDPCGSRAGMMGR